MESNCIGFFYLLTIDTYWFSDFTKKTELIFTKSISEVC